MMSGFARAGRSVGEDFRLVGFDDIEECAQVWPPLSSVRCDIAAFGRATANTVLDWLERGVQPAPEARAPVSLVVRASSAGAEIPACPRRYPHDGFAQRNYFTKS